MLFGNNSPVLGLSPERKQQMAMALAGGSDQWAPIRQALAARRMQAPTSNETLVSPGTAANGGWQTSIQNNAPQGGPLSQLFSASGNGGLLSVLGNIFNKHQQPQAPASGPIQAPQPYVRDMGQGRVRDMAQVLQGAPAAPGVSVGNAPANPFANMQNASPLKLLGGLGFGN